MNGTNNSGMTALKIGQAIQDGIGIGDAMKIKLQRPGGDCLTDCCVAPGDARQQTGSVELRCGGDHWAVGAGMRGAMAPVKTP